MGAIPTFSVVVPCFDQAEFLTRSVDSALDQREVDVQVIVVDDGSRDDTRTVAAAYGDRIELVVQSNLGLPAARNSGLRVAGGDLVCFLDADDWLGSGALRRHAQVAAESEASVFAGGFTLCDADERPFLDGVVDPAIATAPYPFLLAGNRLPCHALSVRRAALTAVGGFDESLTAYEDWDLWLRLAAAGHRFELVPGAGAFYRRHEGTMSRDIDRMLGAARQVLAKHRGRHPMAHRRAWRAIRYGMFCENVLSRARAIRTREGWWPGCRSLVAGLLRRPSLLESMAIHALFAAFPPLRRSVGASEAPFTRSAAAGSARSTAGIRPEA